MQVLLLPSADLLAGFKLLSSRSVPTSTLYCVLILIIIAKKATDIEHTVPEYSSPLKQLLPFAQHDLLERWVAQRVVGPSHAPRPSPSTPGTASPESGTSESGRSLASWQTL